MRENIIMNTSVIEKALSRREAISVQSIVAVRSRYRARTRQRTPASHEIHAD